MALMNLISGQQRRNMENRLMDMGRGEERVRYTESNMETYITRESNGTPLQCSCLENPMGGGAWWAAVYGVA